MTSTGFAMPELTAKTVTPKAQSRDVTVASGHRPALDACYGEIGIPAVAAAARYQGPGKNAAYAPVTNEWKAHFADEPA
jgi:hypothetical protein